jgi:hypothetical protein
MTKTINTAVSANAGVGTSLRQLGALLAGAILAGVVLHGLRPAAPAVPLFLLATATTLELLRKSR